MDRCVCVCVCVCTCKYIHLYTHVHVIVLYNVCGIIDTLLLLLTVMYCNYSLSSSTLVVSLTDPPTPPNTIIQLVVGVTLHTERECQYLLVTVSGILNYYKNNN